MAKATGSNTVAKTDNNPPTIKDRKMLAQGPACALARFSFVKSTRAKAQNNIKRSGPFLCRDLAHFYSAIDSAVKVSAMITSLVVCAAVLASSMSYVRLPQSIAEIIVELAPSEFQLILLLAVFYIFLGLFLDGTSITVMSLPITMPIVMAAGVDPIWFGVFLVIMIELGQITPPVGFNLYLLQSLTGDSLPKVARATLPFFLLLCLAVAVLYVFPEIVLWLPKWIYG